MRAIISSSRFSLLLLLLLNKINEERRKRYKIKHYTKKNHYKNTKYIMMIEADLFF